MTIAITGAAGSLGLAFCRLLKDKANLVGIDNNEWAVAEAQIANPHVDFRLMDFGDVDYLDGVDYLIHLAAYKHVNLGEKNVPEFIENNIYKTQKLFEACKKAGVHFLFVSTDKAVEPISTYGFTKALGERLAVHYGGQVGRLGNVLNSKGSVIPAWEKAIKDKEPIKITDWNMERYVIDEDKAVSELWAGFKLGIKLIIPKMGEPKSLRDILSEVLRKHGYDHTADYEPGIEIIGIRPGEKLSEKLKWENEIS